MFVSSLIMIVSKNSKLDGGIYDRYPASYGVFCPLIVNSTTFNRQANIAYIRAAPDLYGSFVYIVYICATFISAPLVKLMLVLSICLAMWWQTYWEITSATVMNNHNTIPN